MLAFSAICFKIPVEVSFDLVSFLSIVLGAGEFMDISNNAGGLGVLGVRASYMTGK